MLKAIAVIALASATGALADAQTECDSEDGSPDKAYPGDFSRAEAHRPATPSSNRDACGIPLTSNALSSSLSIKSTLSVAAILNLTAPVFH
jgi:hypothetical protein